jgi:hypothetical protein
MAPTIDLLISTRAALLDALEALHAHRAAVVVVGAHAIYMHTGAAVVGLAEATKDSDLALDTRRLTADPLIEDAMTTAGFYRDLTSPQPGAWLNAAGVPVDLLVPESLAGAPGRRGARIPPHSNEVARRVTGLEAAVVDHSPLTIASLSPVDHRTYVVNVAGPAALMVAKLHKLTDRLGDPGRLTNKDAHDLYRLLVATNTRSLARSFAKLRLDPLASVVTEQALSALGDLFGQGPTTTGALMAGRAEEGIGDPETVSAAASVLASELLATIDSPDDRQD